MSADITREKLRHTIHMKMLSRAEDGENVNNATVIRLGFAVSLAEEMMLEAQEQLLQDVHLFVMQEASTYMNSKMTIKGFEKDYTDGISDGKNNAYIRLAQWLEVKRKELKESN